MTETVKRRRYVSPQRQARAEATRRRILAAAAIQFVQAGYGRTSAASIARAAEVSEASVFAVFGSKANLLVEVILDQVTGHSDFPLRAQPSWQAFAIEADKGSAIIAFAAVVCRAHERSWRLLTVAAAAAEGDDELATAVEGGAARRHKDCGWLVREVLGVPEPDAARVTDAMWTLISVENYRHLVVQRGWSDEEYRNWLIAVLTTTLQARDPGRSP
jgi:AcrR family transcriptional regulator